MLYWYVRSVLTDSAKLYPKDIWHFLPMGIYFIVALPEGFLPWHEKVELATKVVEDPGFIGVYKATLLSEIFPQVAVFLSRLLLILGYTLWSMGLLFIYQKREESAVVFSKQMFMKKWLLCLLSFVFVLVTTQVPLVIKSFELHFAEYYFTLKVIQGISVTGLIGLLISPFLFPSVLYGLPRVPESVKDEVKENIKEPSVSSGEIRNQNHFENTYIHSIGQRADACMKEHKPYLQPDCNLAHLSVHIQIPVHHLSYYFREEKKQHFNNYRNEWRINHAKKLIREGKANEITLEAVGLLSGFSSRNTFLNTFKKVEGITPSAFASQSKN